MKTIAEIKPLGQLLRRAPRYGINAAAVPLSPDTPTYLRITDIDESGRFTPNPKVGVAHPNAWDYRLASGELVFARTGASVGKSYLYDPLDGELIYAGFLINIAPDPSLLNPKFLSLIVQTKEYWNWIARTSVRSGQPGVNGREFASFPVPIVPISIQDSIANTMTDVDSLIGTLERLIAKKKAIKQGMMQQLLTGRARLPGFDVPWNETEVCELLEFKNGLNKSSDFFGAGTPIVNFMDVMNGPIITSSDLHGRVTLTKNEINRFSAKRGDLFFTRTSETVDEVGTAAVMVDDVPGACFSGFILRGRPRSSNIDSRFIAHVFQSAAVRKQVTSLATYTTRALTNGRSLGRVSISLPPVDEQRAIAAVIDDADTELLILHSRLTKARAIKTGMMQELLTCPPRLGMVIAGCGTS